jgi:putative aminopeptidase FrvX
MRSQATFLLQEICSIPTAPFAESRVVRYVEQFVAARKRLQLSRDSHGNLLIQLPGKTRSPRWVFTAHMDHPGMVAEKMLDNSTVLAAFRGYVLSELVHGTKVRFFDGDREITGVVTKTIDEQIAPPMNRGTTPKQVHVRVKSPVSPGSIGMFDVGEGRIVGRKFHSRVCDDLAGAAACLAMLDELHAKPPQSTVAVLLTRAEEEGFVGAIAAVLKPKLLKKTDRLVAIECSAMQPYAPQGNGAIIRVGDRTSVFNSDLSYFINAQAEQLAKDDKTFKHQRALMPGGTCEATVYDVYGYLAASICVPLGNYHNMDREKKKIAAEYVDINDWTSMVKLFVQVAKNGHEWKPGHAALKGRLQKRFEGLKHLL